MRRYVALFRGINVGGNNRVPMAELRDTFRALGFANVSSIIQSGNVCFESDDPPTAIEAALRTAVAEQFDVDVPITLRTADEIAAALAAHPFPPSEVEPKLHHVMFLRDPAPPDAADLLAPDIVANDMADDVAILGAEIHVRYVNGSANNKFTVNLVDRRLATMATARNLPTCEKILAALNAS